MEESEIETGETANDGELGKLNHCSGCQTSV